MLGAALAALDLSALLRLAFACLLFIAGWLFLTKKAAPWSFAVNADFEGNEEVQDRHHMPTGRGGSDAVGVGVLECPVCARSASKKCSRCKSVWYCSEACQSKHWKAEHKSKCREVGPADSFDARGTGATRKSSAISLVPGHGTRKVLKEPKKILFPYDEFVKLFDWDKQGFPPCGLLNCGNSCFANVVLQCLACTRPLVAYLLEKDHNKECLRRRDDWCFLCELQVHIKRASESSQSFSPINILSRLPNIGGNLGYGRQEDAHEFMRFAIDTMQSICLDEYGGEKAVDPSTQETTIVQYIFGGHLRSQVICTNCDVVSNRYENMMDLTVEIHGDSESLEECLDQFTVKEWLDGENMYKCDGCNGYVKAWKRLTVHQPPNVLTIALKRFQSGRFGKLNKRVTFPETLDLTPYMSVSGDGADHYALYGVVVHLDMLNASFFGHYICYTKDYRGVWYKIDDCKVIKVEVEEVLAQGAYMLLYHRINPRKDPFVKPVEPATTTHSSETDQIISKTREHTTESSTCDVISMLLDADDPRQNISPSEMPSEFSTLRDTGHDRHLPGFSRNDSEDIDLYGPATTADPPDPLPPKFSPNFLIDNSSAEPYVSNDIKLENSNLLEDASSIKPMPSEASNPADFSSSATECEEEPHSDSSTNLHTEEGDGEIIMEEASTEPVPISSSDQTVSSFLIPSPGSPAITFELSGLANGTCASDASLEREEVSIDDSRTKARPILMRGFLNKPAAKKLAGCEKTAQPENRGASPSSKPNGYSNGHIKFGRDIEMANGDTFSSDSSITSISPGPSNGRRRDRPAVECNGISSSHEEFGREPPCSSLDTSAGICNSTGNGGGFGFEMDEVQSSCGSDFKASKSKASECYRDENQRLNHQNGFTTADFSD